MIGPPVFGTVAIDASERRTICLCAELGHPAALPTQTNRIALFVHNSDHIRTTQETSRAASSTNHRALTFRSFPVASFAPSDNLERTMRAIRGVVGAGILLQAFACSSSGSTNAGPSGTEMNVPNDSGAPRETPLGPPTQQDAGVVDAAPETPLGPACDEDNPITAATTDGSIDHSLPDAIVQFERKWGWNCGHREYHEAREWDYFVATNATDRVSYMQKKGWTRAAVQEGAPGSGLDFLAMHRVMVRTLRDRFPASAALFAGWTAVPTTATTDDPLPSDNPISTAAFWDSMNGAISRVQTNPTSFANDDALGIYIETQHRPTDADPTARSTEPGAGLHTYIHLRFDDDHSPIRMQRFSRNIENQTFWRLHGWIDEVWTAWRKSKGLDDATDSAYLAALNMGCMHMGLMQWDATINACMRM
jgi:hypothetical protein